MHDIVVIGNGESRLKIPNKIYDNYMSFGCNKLILDYTPNYLFAVDPPMIEFCRDKLNDGIKDHLCQLFYPRDGILLNDYEGFVCKTGWKFKGYSTGATALDFASDFASNYGNTVYLVGFDFVKTNKVNNVYKDTENYAKSTDSPITTDNFIKQVCEIISSNENQGVKYVWVNEINDANSSFNNLVLRKYGVDLLSIDDFINREEFNDSRDKEDKR